MVSPMKEITRINRLPARRLRRGESGQAFIEFSLIIMVMTVMLFGLIDFGRFIYQRQVVVNLSREGANLVLRNTSPDVAAAAVLNSSSPLTMNTKGRLFMSTVSNSNGTVQVTSQWATGGLNSVSSKIGAVNSTANMPSTPTKIPAAGKNLYVTEVYYSFTPITPLGKLLKLVMPATLYDVAYF
jgi:Flp pilus assembly protein TadG